MKTCQLMWKMIAYRPGIFFANTIMWILIIISPLIHGLIIREVFDTLGGEARLEIGLWWLLGLLVAAEFFLIILIYLGARLDIFHRFMMSSLIRSNLLRGLLKKPGARPTSEATGEVLNIFRDDVEHAEDSISWITDTLGTLFFFLTAVTILFTINSRITLLVFTPMILVLVIAHWAGERIQRYRKASRDATGEVTGFLGEIFSSIQAIKVNGAEQKVVAHFEKLSERRKQVLVKDSLFNQILESIFNNTANLGTGLILLVSAQAMSTNDFSVGDFTLFIYYLTITTALTGFFGSFLAHYKQARVSFGRMLGILETEPPENLVKHVPLYLTKERPQLSPPVFSKMTPLEKLEVYGLTYSFPGTNKGIKDISFTIKKGSLTVISGRVGSGKSTLLRTLLGLLSKDKGNVYWNGQKIDHPADFFIPPHSAYTSQAPNLFSDTVYNNIVFDLPKEEVDINQAIKSAVLEDDIKDLEEGLETIIGPQGVKLSGGQLQRVAVARMFAHKSDLYVFDDISSALDVETEKTLWNRLFQRSEATCLVVSNRNTLLQCADNIILLKDGRVIGEGSLEELLTSSQEMQTIVGTKTLS